MAGVKVDLTLDGMDASGDASLAWLAILDRAELNLVHKAVAASERARCNSIASFTTRLGNGWLYLFAAMLLIPIRSDSMLRCALVSLVSMAVSFLLYPVLKRSIRRLRPYERDRSLESDVRALDRYSFPSGHAMTAAACGVPFLFAYSVVAVLIVIPIWALISWSRLALGHHYPSDVVAGTVIGVGVACGAAMVVA